MRVLDGSAAPLNHLLRDLPKRSKLPMSYVDPARAMAVFARYQHLMLSLLPIGALLTFVDRSTLRWRLDEATRKHAGKIAKVLFTCGRTAEARASEKFAALANAR